MNEPVTTFLDENGTRLSRWAIKAGMLITGVTYDARSGCMDIVVKEPTPADDVPLAHKPRVYMHDGGCHVSIGFDDTQDTILTVTEHPAEAYGDIAHAREWVAAVRPALGQEPQDA